MKKKPDRLERINQKMKMIAAPYSRRAAAVKANIRALADILAATTARAVEAADQRTNDGAIGTLVGIEPELESALALYRAALALHRNAGGVQ